MTIGRRRFLQGTVVAGAAAATGAVPALALAADEAAHAERVTFQLPGLDPAHDGVRIAQLSDLHVGPGEEPALYRDAIAQANAFAPDLVVLTGDFLSRSPGDVEHVRARLAGLTAPAVAVLGNHDNRWDAAGTARALRALGYEVLENAWTRVRVRGVPLVVVGVGDHLSRREEVDVAVAGVPPAVTPVVLAHGPRTADRLRALTRPLVCFSGHTHGGQVSLPIITPIALRTVHEPYRRGLYRLGDVQLYVNRGIGTSGVRIRIGSPPEVTLATLRRAEPGAAASWRTG